jgi:hypothetical protein
VCPATSYESQPEQSQEKGELLMRFVAFLVISLFEECRMPNQSLHLRTVGAGKTKWQPPHQR